MRYLLAVLLGLFVGALCTTSAMNVLRQGNALPRGLMAVMDHQMEQVRTIIGAESCDGAQRHFETIRLLASDIEPAFMPSGKSEPLFAKYAQDLQREASLAAAQPATQCKALAEQLGRLGDGCKACHRDFK